MMKKLLKEYEAPLCDVVECVVEGVIAGSGDVTNTTESTDQSSNWGLINGN